MTSISGVGMSHGSGAVSFQPPPAPPAGGQKAMAGVADKLGLSTDDLKTQLQSGKTLNDVASAQGVSHEDLIAAIKASMPTDQVSGVQATDLAEKIAGNQGLPPGGPGGPGGLGGPRGELAGMMEQSKVDQLGKLLEMDPAEVSESASSPTALVNLLKDKGVDLTALRAVLGNGDLVDVSA